MLSCYSVVVFCGGNNDFVFGLESSGSSHDGSGRTGSGAESFRGELI